MITDRAPSAPVHRKSGPLRATALAFLITALAAQAETDKAKEKESKPEEPEKIDQAYVREHYTKFEYEVPMRDGVNLLTAICQPKDDAQPYPILLTRTPYSLKPYSVDLYPDPRGPLFHYAKERFIFVVQDVRGRNGSGGEFGSG